MQRWVWTNPYLPQTLQISVVIAYFSAVIQILFTGVLGLNVFLFGIIGLTVLGAFGVANLRWWGYIISVVMAILPFVLDLMIVTANGDSLGKYFASLFLGPNIINTIFQIAILALLIHPMSWHYVKQNFEKTIP